MEYIDEETMLATNTLFKIADIMPVIQKKESVHKHEFQELCTELQPIYGKVVWTLPYRSGFTEYKIREAHRIATEKGIQKFGYLVGILRRMP